VQLTERRTRNGHYEWLCRCGRWYWKLAQHIHRYHIGACMCLAGGKPCKARREGRVKLVHN